MSIFLQTFESVAMLLFIGVVGFWILSRRMVPATALQVLGRLALEVALPCLVFVTILRHFDPSRSAAWWSLPLWWVGFTVLAGGMTYLLTRIVALEHRPEFGLALFYQNATFFPLAVLTQLYGADSPYIVDLFLFVMLFGAFLFSTYPLFFAGTLRTTDWRKIFHPVFLVTVLAIFVRLSGTHQALPSFGLSALEMVGQMTVPLLMLILGGSIYLDFQTQKGFKLFEVAKFVALKNFIFPG
ncbi:MAG: AEC family transporter, partial [Planctomycetota bacterium]